MDRVSSHFIATPFHCHEEKQYDAHRSAAHATDRRASFLTESLFANAVEPRITFHSNGAGMDALFDVDKHFDDTGTRSVKLLKCLPNDCTRNFLCDGDIRFHGGAGL
jgi:hypothetical protein